MGRFTIFALEDCPHCQRTKSTFQQYGIPYVEINLSLYPHRRSDMLSLSDALTVPQVFLNETHVGGADDTIQLLQQWAKDEDWTPLQQYQNFVANAPDPNDKRLQPVNPEAPLPPEVQEQLAPPPERDESHVIPLPNEDRAKTMTVLEMTELLKSILPCRDLKYNLTLYKNAFKANELIDALEGVFSLSRQDALEYGRSVLQEQFQLIGHVVDNHPLQDTPTLYFRLACYQHANILNSFRPSWTERVDPNPLRLLKTLKSKLSRILKRYTNDQGNIDYVQAKQDNDFPALEEATCELLGIDLEAMQENYNLKLAFCINLYNFMIPYAFCKVGIGTTDTARYAFFTTVKFQIGKYVLSFQDLENGILRGNRKAPYTLLPQFSKSDPRCVLIMPKVDCRIHFALNCGATSCPPVKTFTAHAIEEELRVVSLAFCQDNVSVDDNTDTITVSKIMYWYQEDFGGGGSKALVSKLVKLTKGKTQVALQSLLTLDVTPKIKYTPYDWSTNASNCIPFSGSNVKSNSSRFLS